MDLLEVDYKKPQRIITDPIDYEGFPQRYKHWKWDEEYEKLPLPEKLPIITDRIISSNPVVVYCLDGKTWTYQINNTWTLDK